MDKFHLELLDLKELDQSHMKERRATNDIVERAVAVESLAFLEQQMTSSFAIVGIEIKTANFIEVYNQYKEYLYRSYMLNFIRIDGII